MVKVNRSGCKGGLAAITAIYSFSRQILYAGMANQGYRPARLRPQDYRSSQAVGQSEKVQILPWEPSLVRDRRLLVIDDEPVFCEFVRRVAEAEGFDVPWLATATASNRPTSNANQPLSFSIS
jgi:hypothetical protein